MDFIYWARFIHAKKKTRNKPNLGLIFLIRCVHLFRQPLNSEFYSAIFTSSLLQDTNAHISPFYCTPYSQSTYAITSFFSPAVSCTKIPFYEMPVYKTVFQFFFSSSSILGCYFAVLLLLGGYFDRLFVFTSSAISKIKFLFKNVERRQA